LKFWPSHATTFDTNLLNKLQTHSNYTPLESSCCNYNNLNTSIKFYQNKLNVLTTTSTTNASLTTTQTAAGDSTDGNTQIFNNQIIFYKIY